MIQAVSNSPAATPASTAKPKMNLDPDDFLQLLIAQLKAQDPTSPADSTQFVSQLSSMSSVEQSIQTNAKLDSLLSGLASMQVSSLIGKQLSSLDGLTSGLVTSGGVFDGAGVVTLDTGAQLDLSKNVRISG